MNASIKKKVNGIGLAGKIVSIVLIVCMALGCFGLLVGTIALAVVPKDAVRLTANTGLELSVKKSSIMITGVDDMEDIDKALKLAGIDLELPDEDIPVEFDTEGDSIVASIPPMHYEFSASDLIPVLLTGLIRCACMLVIFIFLLRLSDAFRTCDSPFDAKVIKRMTVFAWVLLGGAVLMGVSFTGRVEGMGIVSGLGGLSYTTRFTPVLIALIVLFLTAVFRYGAQLQKEADETL